MSEISYNDYNVDLILSTEKNPNKKNLIKINSKYYFQIPNQHEEELENNDETCYYEDIQIDENGSYARILSLSDLYNICKYFKLQDGIAALLILQFLNFKQIDEYFIEYSEQCSSHVLKFIQKHNHIVLTNLLRPLNRYHDAIKTYSQFLTHFLIFHNSLANVCAQQINIKKIEDLVLQNRSKEITEEESENFVLWMELLGYKILSPSTIFNECFNLEKEDVWTVQRVQRHLDESINNLQLNEKYINKFKLQMLFKNFNQQNLFFNENHIRNQQYPKITKEQSKQKCYVEMRYKMNKYRLAVNSQSSEFLQTMFYKNDIKMQFNSKIVNKVKKELEDKYQSKFYLFLDLKDFCLNVDNDVVEKLIYLPELANYLRQRKVYYVDPVTKKEEQLILRKGIIIGEVYHNYILTCLSELLLSIVKETFCQQFQELSHILNYSNHLDDFFIEIEIAQNVDKSKLIELIEGILKNLEENFNKIGFSINMKKLQLLANQGGQINAWKINDQLKFSPCQSFVIFQQDLLKANDNAQENRQQQIDQLINQLWKGSKSQYKLNQKEKDQIDQLSKMEKYFLVKFLKTSKNVNLSWKNDTIKYIQNFYKQENVFEYLDLNADNGFEYL
ncbi:hypothetical protein ABPG72_014418 [Tetrahymena utriculariae]